MIPKKKTKTKTQKNHPKLEKKKKEKKEKKEVIHTHINLHNRIRLPHNKLKPYIPRTLRRRERILIKLKRPRRLIARVRRRNRGMIQHEPHEPFLLRAHVEISVIGQLIRGARFEIQVLVQAGGMHIRVRVHGAVLLEFVGGVGVVAGGGEGVGGVGFVLGDPGRETAFEVPVGDGAVG